MLVSRGIRILLGLLASNLIVVITYDYIPKLLNKTTFSTRLVAYYYSL